jgi:Tol biopolymer transport system component
VQDAYDNLIAGLLVTFTVSSGGGSIDGSPALTDVRGFAESGVWTLGPAPGPQGVTVSAGAIQIEIRAHAEAAPACAPDCGRIAFVSFRDGNPEIYSVNWDGTDLTRLTNDAAEDDQPAWSPDGQRIAFTSDRSGSQEIYVMNADGSGVVRRTSSGGGRSASWSPDGTRIVYSAARLEPPSDELPCGASSSDLWLVDAEGDDATPTPLFSAGALSRSDEPAWAPGGTRIALTIVEPDVHSYCDESGTGPSPQNISLIDDAGSVVGALTWGGSQLFYSKPSWSPSGDELVLTVWGYTIGEWTQSMVVMNADGSDPEPLLTASLVPGGNASWSPDGELIAVDGVGWFRADGNGQGIVHITDGWDPDWRR